jgi:two-component system LytT family sensor kinase
MNASRLLIVNEKQILDLECDDDVGSARGVLTVSSKIMRVTSLGRKPIRWLAYLGGWTLFAVLFISEDAGRLVLQRQPVQWHGLFVVWLTTAFAWAFLTPFVWWLATRFPFDRKTWRRNVGLHLVSCFTFALIETILFSAITPMFGLPWFPRKFFATFQAVLLIDFHLNVILYWAIVGIQHGVNYYRKFEERERLSAQLELRATQLENQLTQARLSTLKMQLHPHFLFNTLNAIVILVRQHRAGEADEMLTNLSELLRQTLEGWETQEIPLRREVELINLYLDIQRVRFQDRLTVEMNLSPATLSALVPSLLLQPLVENAVRHGVSRTSAPVRIELKSNCRDSLLEIQVCDNGPGVSGESSGNGVGLSNTRARLQQLYGDRQSLRLAGLAGGGTTVTVLLPYHPEEDHPHEAAR